jgi:hypothetical protein
MEITYIKASVHFLHLTLFRIMCGCNIEIIPITEIYEVSVNIYLYECQITEPPAVIAGQVVTERTVCVLLTGELCNAYCDALMSAEKKVEYF